MDQTAEQLRKRYMSIIKYLRECDSKYRNSIYRLVSASSLNERDKRWYDVISELQETTLQGGMIANADGAETTPSLIGTVDYPAQLYQLFDPPLLLYGEPHGIQIPPIESCVAIVGSRKADDEGIAYARSLAKVLSQFGITVVSGLAYGADAAAHWGALSSKNLCPTIAVLGSGLSEIYPRGNEKLARKIYHSGGVLLSEYEPDVSPRKHHFLERNRIIAGLSCAVIVIQAAKRSGALSTARHALELGRDVFVMPGSYQNPLYEGSNALMKDGATPLASPKELVEHLGLKSSSKMMDENDEGVLTNQECLRNELLAYLATNGPSRMTSLLKRFKDHQEALQELLIELEVKEEVKKLSWNRYCIY